MIDVYLVRASVPGRGIGTVSDSTECGFVVAPGAVTVAYGAVTVAPGAVVGAYSNESS